MENETDARFTLKKEIVDMIDELKWLEIHGGDPSSVVSLAILQLYSESKNGVEKAEEDSIDQHLVKEAGLANEVEYAYFNSKLSIEELKRVLSELDSGESISMVAIQPYGEGYLGLIWNFHNRILPIKFVLHAIASDIVQNKKIPSLETARTIAGEQGSIFADKIHTHGNDGRFHLDWEDVRRYRILVGFPKTLDAVMEQPKIKKYSGRGKSKATHDRKLQEAFQDSKYFFVDKFLGNELKISKKKQDEIDFYKNNDFRKFGGACFEMGLVKVDGDSRLSLTKLGLEFLGYENPILVSLEGQVRSGLLKMSGKVLSEDEVEFIIKKIIRPQFGLEYKMIKNILENSDMLSITQIMLMLKNEQQGYIEKNRIENRIDERDNGNLIKYRQQRATSTAMRLVEMGLLERKIEDELATEDSTKIAKSDDKYEDALRSEIEKRIESKDATEDEVTMFVNSEDAEEIAEKYKVGETQYQKKLIEWLGRTKRKSDLGRPKAFYRRTDFGREIYEKILSKNS